MKTAVLGEPEPGEIVYHPTLLALASHYDFLVRACKPYRAKTKTKGKVERPFRYIRQDFFLGATFEDLEDLNRQFDHWCRDVAHRRVHGTTARVVAEHFADERSALGALTSGDFHDVLSMERLRTHLVSLKFGAALEILEETVEQLERNELSAIVALPLRQDSCPLQ